MPQVLYSVKARVAIAYVRPDGLTEGGETIDQVRERYPDARLASQTTAMIELENAFCCAPVEITREQFDSMRDVLPPMGWVRTAYSESFKLSERTYGSVTAIFVRLGTRFFQLKDRAATTHDTLVARCQALTVSTEPVVSKTPDLHHAFTQEGTTRRSHV